jgi:exonuclease III
MADADPEYKGRPYGGVSIIYRKSKKCNILEIETTNTRTIAVGIRDNSGALKHVIVNMYMPYYDGTKGTQTDEYIECLDVLQTFIDKYAQVCPIKVMGDFNAQLPRTVHLCRNWQRAKCFNSHSLLLHDFIMANNLLTMDLAYEQSVQYTYFCIKRNVFTWIDHALTTTNGKNSVLSCKIIPLQEGNVSDHLPVRMTFSIEGDISCTKQDALRSVDCQYSYPRALWGHVEQNEAYRAALEAKLSALPLQNLSGNSRDGKEQAVNDFITNVNSAMHEPCEEAGCVKQKHGKPRSFWCPELGLLKHRKRFWWRLWKLNNRPRSGEVYECWKAIKK